MTATLAQTATTRRTTHDTPLSIRSVEIIRIPSEPVEPRFSITIHNRDTYRSRLAAIREFALASRPSPLSADPIWLTVLQSTMGHDPYIIEAVQDGQTVGYLPLAAVNSLLFGHYLVSLPYLNSNGVVSKSAEVREHLITRAADLAEELSVKHLELRHESEVFHTRLNARNDSKAHMRLALPATTELLWKGFDPKVRNQIRKAEKSNFVVTWGGVDQLDAFMAVITQNMRDLGTPFYSRQFFETILTTFPGDAEIAVLRTAEGQAVAAGLLLHGHGVTEVPSASSLKEFNSTCANMQLYHQLLNRAVERGQSIFDFGRSTQDGPTFKFKKQWGAKPSPAVWQYASRGGSISDARPDNPKYRLAIKVWQKLPTWLTSRLGPKIVRGIP